MARQSKKLVRSKSTKRSKLNNVRLGKKGTRHRKPWKKRRMKGGASGAATPKFYFTQDDILELGRETLESEWFHGELFYGRKTATALLDKKLRVSDEAEFEPGEFLVYLKKSEDGEKYKIILIVAFTDTYTKTYTIVKHDNLYKLFKDKTILNPGNFITLYEFINTLITNAPRNWPSLIVLPNKKECKVKDLETVYKNEEPALKEELKKYDPGTYVKYNLTNFPFYGHGCGNNVVMLVTETGLKKLIIKAFRNNNYYFLALGSDIYATSIDELIENINEGITKQDTGVTERLRTTFTTDISADIPELINIK